MSPEGTVVRNYLDWLLSIPWNKNSKINKNLVDTSAVRRRVACRNQERSTCEGGPQVVQRDPMRRELHAVRDDARRDAGTVVTVAEQVVSFAPRKVEERDRVSDAIPAGLLRQHGILVGDQGASNRPYEVTLALGRIPHASMSCSGHS